MGLVSGCQFTQLPDAYLMSIFAAGIVFYKKLSMRIFTFYRSITGDFLNEDHLQDPFTQKAAEIDTEITRNLQFSIRHPPFLFKYLNPLAR